MSDQVPAVTGEPTEKPTTGALPPAFSLEQLNESIQKSVSSAVREQLAQDNQARVVEEPTQHREVNPLESIIAPIVAPGMQQVRQLAEAAQDAAVFYGKNPGAAADSERIEKVFNNMLAQGTPIGRDAIQKFLWGTDKDKIVQDAIKQHDAELAKAKDAADGGGSLNPAGRSVTPVEAHALPPDELEKAMANATF